MTRYFRPTPNGQITDCEKEHPLRIGWLFEPGMTAHNGIVVLLHHEDGDLIPVITSSVTIPTPTPPRIRSMPEFLEMVEKSTKDRRLATEGFARAFLDATGLKPQEAVMVVQEMELEHPIDGSMFSEKIWFEKRSV